jgi:rubrerythrin
MAEFAINDSVSPTTGFTPFQLMYGMHPRKPIDMIAESKAPAAEEFIKRMTAAINKTRENIDRAQLAMKIQADKRRRDHSFKIGDMVMLSTKNLKLPSTHSRKLSPKWIGPFKIIGQRHKDSFQISLPQDFKIHPVFHVNLLKPWINNDSQEFPDRHQDPPPAVIINDQEEFEAEAIIKKRTRYGKTQYLVKWKGYRDEDCTWEPEDNLQNAPDLIREFNQKSSRRVQIIQINSQNGTPQSSGRTLYKEGDGTHWISNNQPLKKSPNMLTHDHHCTPITHQKVDRFSTEARHELETEKEARNIQCYSIKKFVEVTSEQGEKLIGYETISFNIYYYRPGTMTFLSMHSAACDCKMCEWITKPPCRRPSPKRQVSPRHQPYQPQIGKRTSNNKKRPGTPTPVYQAPTSPASPRWEDLPEGCEWTEDPWPIEEATQTRELDILPTTQEMVTDYWQKQHLEVTHRIANMDMDKDLRKKICPMVPEYSANRNRASAEDACMKTRRAELLLQEASDGKKSYGEAYKAWVFYLHRCEHGTAIYHAEWYCPSCEIVATDLNSHYQDDWAHIKKEPTV